MDLYLDTEFNGFGFNRSLFVFLARFQDVHVHADWYTDLVHFFDSFARALRDWHVGR